MVSWLASLIPGVLKIGGDVIDQAVEDKDKRNQLKADLQRQLNERASTELKGAIDVILAEAKGESWLQRNWRPLMMVWFAGLVGAHWFGFTPENMPKEVVMQLYQLVQIGIGGYVVGRSAEKGIKAWKAKE